MGSSPERLERLATDAESVFGTVGLFGGLMLKSQVAGQRIDAGQSRAMMFIWLDMQSVGLGREPVTSLWVWTTGGVVNILARGWRGRGRGRYPSIEQSPQLGLFEVSGALTEA